MERKTTNTIRHMMLEHLLIFIIFIRLVQISTSSVCSEIVNSESDSANLNNLLRFFLYPDPSNELSFDELLVGNPNSLARFDPEKYLIFIIHGFQQNSEEKYPQYTKNAYLRNAAAVPANIVLVDWRDRAQPNLGYIKDLTNGYMQATSSLDLLACQIVKMILFLMSQAKIRSPAAVHLVGFSLGGQMAGLVGYKILQTSGVHLGRITGLDPAGLDFHLKINEKDRLDASDAEFVDVIHTGIATYGYKTSVGHVDFYPNGGGPKQPGCKLPLDFKSDLAGLPGSCAHSRAWDFFIQSIYTNSIWACSGRDWIQEACAVATIFGQYTPYTKRGDFFLQISPRFDTANKKWFKLFK